MGLTLNTNYDGPDEVDKILAATDYNPLDRFLVFGGGLHYPAGGMNDFIFSARTLDDAKGMLLERALAGHSMDWVHIYDSHMSKSVWEHRRYT